MWKVENASRLNRSKYHVPRLMHEGLLWFAVGWRVFPNSIYDENILKSKREFHCLMHSLEIQLWATSLGKNITAIWVSLGSLIMIIGDEFKERSYDLVVD